MAGWLVAVALIVVFAVDPKVPAWFTAVAVFIAFAVVALAAWWFVPKWQANLLKLKIRDAKARADVEDNWRKTIGQLIGGVAVLIGAGIAYYQSQVAQQATHDQIQAARDQLISQQVSKGFEQLGNENLVIRLGGIYALEGVMNTSEQYYQPVLEALCAFVRLNAKPKDTKNEPVEPAEPPVAPPVLKELIPNLYEVFVDPRPSIEPLVAPSTDIQAALTVILRRKPGQGHVDLTGADLSHTNLTHATLHDSDLRGANLTKANLSGGDLNNINLTGANLTSANLTGADLVSANLTRANLTRADLTGAILISADLTSANMLGVEMSGNNFDHRDLMKGPTNLQRANLRSANLTGANIEGVDMRGATLSYANLSHANLRHTLLIGAFLDGANLSGANLSMTAVTQERLDRACGNKETMLDKGLTIKPCQP